MMVEWFHLLILVLLQGLIYSLVVMGVYLSSRVIQFDDLTTEGSFGLGGAITAYLLVMGASGWIALPLAIAAGACAGAATGMLNRFMHMNNLISGLVVTTALFSLCLATASANLCLPAHGAIFGSNDLYAVLLLFLIVLSCYQIIKKLLGSQVGFFLTAAGCNPQIVTSLGKNVTKYKILSLSIANSLTALAGSLFVQWSGFFSITGNIGTLITGIAGLILAETIRPKFTWALIAGAILYQAIFALTIELEFPPVWNNLIKAVLIVLLIQLKPKKANRANNAC